MQLLSHKMHFFSKKTHFFLENIWSCRKNVVILQPISQVGLVRGCIFYVSRLPD